MGQPQVESAWRLPQSEASLPLTTTSRDGAGPNRDTRPNGQPDMAHVSTSCVERASRCARTRLANAFSKKVEGLGHAVALHFMHYNFCRIHGLGIEEACRPGDGVSYRVEMAHRLTGCRKRVFSPC
jgi:hypothetical protein